LGDQEAVRAKLAFVGRRELRNISLCEARLSEHFPHSPLLIIIAQSQTVLLQVLYRNESRACFARALALKISSASPRILFSFWCFVLDKIRHQSLRVVPNFAKKETSEQKIHALALELEDRHVPCPTSLVLRSFFFRRN